jgi:hypothetical protein
MTEMWFRGSRPCCCFLTCCFLICLQRESEIIVYAGEWLDSERDKMHVYGCV